MQSERISEKIAILFTKTAYILREAKRWKKY